jgi:hypothetical protein
MPMSLYNELPETLKRIATRPLFVLRLNVQPYQII